MNSETQLTAMEMFASGASHADIAAALELTPDEARLSQGYLEAKLAVEMGQTPFESFAGEHGLMAVHEGKVQKVKLCN